MVLKSLKRVFPPWKHSPDLRPGTGPWKSKGCRGDAEGVGQSLALGLGRPGFEPSLSAYCWLNDLDKRCYFAKPHVSDPGRGTNNRPYFQA